MARRNRATEGRDSARREDRLAATEAHNYGRNAEARPIEENAEARPVEESAESDDGESE